MGDTLRKKYSYLKRISGWTLMSATSAVTHPNWYHPRDYIRCKPEPLCFDASANLFDTSQLQILEAYLLNHHTRAFLIWHQGKLVHQLYHNFLPEQQFNSMSLVKSIIGLCVGIAIDKGMINSEHDLAKDYLPEWQQDERQYISIAHLLSMQSGLRSDVTIDWSHPLPSIIPLQFGSDIRQIALTCPVAASPQKQFVYNNYNSQLLGIILERASGLTFMQFLAHYLWQPLGCGEAYGWTDDYHMARTFGGLFATPEDWVKVASLFINNGNHKGQQVVSAQWLDKMKTPTNTESSRVKKPKSDYGYHLWLKAHDYGVIAGIPKIEGMYAKKPHQDDSLFYFEGMRGQYVFISPRHKLIVLRMGEKPKTSWDGSYVINELTAALESKISK